MPVSTNIPGRTSDYQIDVRKGICEKCHIHFERIESPELIVFCPQCKGVLGKDILGEIMYVEKSVMFPELPPLPAQPTCYTIRCIEDYKWELDRWASECKKLAELYRMIHEYHAVRCRYCMRHCHEHVDDKYIMGTQVPVTIKEIKNEIKKLRR
jgi:hypothetical protein